MVAKAASVCLGVRHWPSDGMFDKTRLMFAWIDLPQFFDSDSVNLIFVVGVEIVMLHQLFGQLTPASFAEDGALGVKLHASLKAVLGRSVFGHAHIIGGDAFDTPILVKQHF